MLIHPSAPRYFVLHDDGVGYDLLFLNLIGGCDTFCLIVMVLDGVGNVLVLGESL